MELEHYPIDKLKLQIIDIVGRYLDLKNHHVFFFGSRVSSGGHDTSDIDIGIEGPETIPYSTMRKIREDLENIHTLYIIDVVDFRGVAPEFREVAMEHVEPIQG